MQITIIANRTNQLADKQINNLLAGQRIVGCTDNTLRLAGGRTLAIANDGRGIIDRNAPHGPQPYHAHPHENQPQPTTLPKLRTHTANTPPRPPTQAHRAGRAHHANSLCENTRNHRHARRQRATMRIRKHTK